MIPLYTCRRGGDARFFVALLLLALAVCGEEASWAQTSLSPTDEDSGAEVVVVLDTSCSMGTSSKLSLPNGTVRTLPANDPERLAVLGAQVIQALGNGPRDRVTIIGFGQSENDAPASTAANPDLRKWGYAGGTWFKKPIRKAVDQLEASTLSTRMLIVLTDGMPQDVAVGDAAAISSLFDPQQHPDIETLALGLFNDAVVREQGELFLGALLQNPERDLIRVEQPGQVIEGFTEGFARAIGSRPLTGQLRPRAEQRFTVGRFVSEVMTFVVSADPGTKFRASLAGTGGDAELLGRGDNGCDVSSSLIFPPQACGGKRRHFEVYRATNNPDAPSDWVLSLPESDGLVHYGVILRYDLVAAVDTEETVRAGVESVIKSRLVYRGETFDDEDFFAADGFAAVAHVEGEELELHHDGAGVFSATWTPREDGVDSRSERVRVEFHNDWMTKRAVAELTVEPPPYRLVVRPSVLQVGPIPSLWESTSRCATLDLSESEGIDGLEISCRIEGQTGSADVRCERVGTDAMQVCGAIQRWCCGQELPLTITVAGPGGVPPRTAATVPTTVSVSHPGFLRCHWRGILVFLGTAFTLWFVYGWIRPHSFDASVTVTIAGSVKGLKRAAPRVLRECPRGKRGFYRSALVAIGGGGGVMRKASGAAVVVEAGPGGSLLWRRASGLEYQDRRTRKWKPLEPLEEHREVLPGVVYRAGDLHVKFD